MVNDKKIVIYWKVSIHLTNVWKMNMSVTQDYESLTSSFYKSFRGHCQQNHWVNLYDYDFVRKVLTGDSIHRTHRWRAECE